MIFAVFIVETVVTFHPDHVVKKGHHMILYVVMILKGYAVYHQSMNAVLIILHVNVNV